MLKRLFSRMKVRPPNDHAPSVGVLAIPAASVATLVRARSVAHRNTAGHEPVHEASLRAPVIDRARYPVERAFVSGPSSTDSSTEERGEDFVMTVTSGGGEAALDEEPDEESGRPFVETSASEEFAYDMDETNPASATREPFPTS